MRHAFLGALVASVALTSSARSFAGAPIDTTAKPEEKLSPWDHGSARAFVAGRIDAGIVFARPAFMLGYGRPHWEWFGVEAYALTTNSFGAVYAGTRASLPFLDFTIGVRDTLSYRRSFLPQRASYVADDVDAAHGPRARYLSLDVELTGVVPLLGGYVLWGFVSTTILDAPKDVLVFDESLRVVMRQPAAIDFRFGYIHAIGREGPLKLGVLSETIALPHRDGPVERIGPLGTLSLTDHTEVVAVFTVAVWSPDALGILHSPYGFLGLRYRWATGDQQPSFP